MVYGLFTLVLAIVRHKFRRLVFDYTVGFMLPIYTGSDD